LVNIVSDPKIHIHSG